MLMSAYQIWVESVMQFFILVYQNIIRKCLERVIVFIYFEWKKCNNNLMLTNDAQSWNKDPTSASSVCKVHEH